MDKPLEQAPETDGPLGASKKDVGKVPLFRGVIDYFPRALTAVGEVSAFGAQKYAWHGWRNVPDGFNRYRDGLSRHLLKSAIEELDEDSGLDHLAHLAWNALAILELKRHKAEEDEWYAIGEDGSVAVPVVEALKDTHHWEPEELEKFAAAGVPPLQCNTLKTMSLPGYHLASVDISSMSREARKHINETFVATVMLVKWHTDNGTPCYIVRERLKGQTKLLWYVVVYRPWTAQWERLGNPGVTPADAMLELDLSPPKCGYCSSPSEHKPGCVCS